MESKKFKVFVEYKVARESKEPDIPDLFLITPNAFYFIEEKGSLPRDHAKLDLEITKVLGYRSDHAFEGAKFVPQIILLCPSRIYEERASRLRYYGKELPIVTYDAPLEDPIVLKQVQGQVLDSKIKPFLTGSSRIPHARSVVPQIKFLRKDPPLPYSAWFIWQIVWSYASSTSNDFSVKYSAILEKCRSFYPTWLLRDVEQITQGRLNDGLELLAYIGWVKYDGRPTPSTDILIHYSKGDRLRSPTLDYLARWHVRLKAAKAIKPRKRTISTAVRIRIPKPSSDDSQLDRFLSIRKSGG